MSESSSADILTELRKALGVGHDDRRALELIPTLAALVAEMNAVGRERNDPIREIPARLGDRWSTLLLILLRFAPFRHASLKRVVAVVSAEGRISQRMMTLRLRALERDGLIRRAITPSVPPRVEYSITPLGLGLLEQLDALMAWIRHHNEAIRLNRQRFDLAED